MNMFDSKFLKYRFRTSQITLFPWNVRRNDDKLWPSYHCKGQLACNCSCSSRIEEQFLLYKSQEKIYNFLASIWLAWNKTYLRVTLQMRAHFRSDIHSIGNVQLWFTLWHFCTLYGVLTNFYLPEKNHEKIRETLFTF